MNLFAYTIPDEEEAFSTLLEHKNIKIVRILSADKITPKTYIQEEDEWVIVLEGEAKLRLGEEEKVLGRGESLLIPANTPHKVLQTAKGTLWLAVHIS